MTSLSLSLLVKTNAGGQPLSHVSQQQLVPPPGYTSLPPRGIGLTSLPRQRKTLNLKEQDSSPQNDNSSINYSPLCHSKLNTNEDLFDDKL